MRVAQISLVSIGLMFFSFAAHAQSAERPARAPLQLRVAETNDPALREALNDPEVQAALREHVRGIDVRNPFETYSAFPLSAPRQGEADERGPSEIRILPERRMESLRRQDGARTRVRPGPGGPGGAGDLNVTPRRPHLDVEYFGWLVDGLLQGNVNGYVLQLRQQGQTVLELEQGWAQRPEDAGIDWNVDRRQHVASISKFITAMGLAHMLNAQGIDFDSPIIDYLPDHWATGPNVDAITFAHLINHISGFHGPESGTSNYLLMRARVAQGVPANDVGNWLAADYENMNFGLCRFLMATLGGYIDTDATFGANTDIIWNWIAIVAYADYIDENVFGPAGVSGAVLANAPDSARAYAWNDTGEGWDSGILTGESGGAGWHLTADEVLDVVGEFRRGGGIVSPQQAQQIMNLSYGLNSPLNGFPASTGPFFYKMGRWWNGEPDKQAEQSAVMVLPEDMELVIFVNSPLGVQDMLLQDFIGTAYLLSIVE